MSWPARFRAIATYRCNPLHRSWWPIVADPREVVCLISDPVEPLFPQFEDVENGMRLSERLLFVRGG
ncbi:hypothetical protein GCM10007301_47910 [Azorhizobium oxalatiphilum]|uniref:Uncharacterized protein n=1 Tax=Azorhizobium oxalatiphilum TaxID=980631 RepID=A0A917CBG7_9HYPH|nr:hypothetical protein GCM10007301_47910 [Azorhizobium oxalatiphilum]